jgi:spore maturation protein CgeB
MKIAIIDSYYASFLKQFHHKKPDIQVQSYNNQLQSLLSSCFGTADFYSYNLKKLSHNAIDIIANNEFLQKQWAKEHNFQFSSKNILSTFQSFPFLYKWIGRPKWIQEITIEQIRKYEPDIVYIQDITILDPWCLAKIKSLCKLLVGQIACPLPPDRYVQKFDLILTSFPHFVDIIQKKGVKSEYFKLGFESRILNKIGTNKRIYDVVFIGSFSPYHSKGTKILEELARKIPLHVWGNGVQYISLNSPLRKNFHGQVWGLDMFKILSQSKIVINRHIDVAQNNANNMRMYEATGMGTLLITDDKKNLENLFIPNEEVVSYRNSMDLEEKVTYYLTHEKERIEISKAGQKRTLKDHAYLIRMKELIIILRKYI